MNYPNLPSQSRRRPARKSNFMLLLILGFMAFFLYSQYKKATVLATPDGEVADFSVPDEIAIDGPRAQRAGGSIGETRTDRDGLPIGTAPAGNGDWEADTNVELEEEDPNFVVGSDRGNPGGETKSGDWGIEVGASQESDGGTAVQTPPEAKRSKEGDWELSEVEVEKSK